MYIENKIGLTNCVACYAVIPLHDAPCLACSQAEALDRTLHDMSNAIVCQASRVTELQEGVMPALVRRVESAFLICLSPGTKEHEGCTGMDPEGCL